MVIRGLDFKEVISLCVPPGGATAVIAENLAARVETFSWDGTLSPDRQDGTAASLAIRVSDSVSDSNYRRLPPVTIREGAPAELRDVALRIIDNFIGLYRGR